MRRLGFAAMVCSLLIAVLLALASPLYALVALVIQTPVAEPTTPLGKLLLTALIPVIAWLAKLSYDGLKTAIPWYDKKVPAVAHQFLAPFWGAFLGFVSAKLGLTIIQDLGGIDGAWLNSAGVALVQLGLFRAEKRKAPADATVIIEASRNSQPA